MNDNDQGAGGVSGSPGTGRAVALTAAVFAICVLAILALTAINTYFGGAVVDGETARALIAILVSVALAILIYTLFEATSSAFHWNIPFGPAINLTGAGALAAAFYFFVVSQFNPTTDLSLLVSRGDGRFFEKNVEVYFRLGGMFYTSVYQPSQRAVNFSYLPKGSELEVGVNGDTYLVEQIGDRTDNGCEVVEKNNPIIKASSDCNVVEIILIGRGQAEDIGIHQISIGVPSGSFRMPLGELLERFPLRRIKSELERLEAPTQLEVIYRPTSIEETIYSEEVDFNITEDGNTPVCEVFSNIFQQYRRRGSLTGLDFHVEKRTLTIHLPGSKPAAAGNCTRG